MFSDISYHLHVSLGASLNAQSTFGYSFTDYQLSSFCKLSWTAVTRGQYKDGIITVMTNKLFKDKIIIADDRG